MMTSLILNGNLLTEQDISALEFIYLYYLYTGDSFSISFNDVDLEKLQEKKLIKISSKKEVILRQKSIDLIEFSLIEADVSFDNKKKTIKKSSRTINNEIKEFVDEFRKKWHGLKPGSMGSKSACIKKFLKWMKENPEISKEQILAAADLYLSTEGKDIRFLQRADYFIYKNESSRLSAYVDDLLMGSNPNEDWTSQLN